MPTQRRARVSGKLIGLAVLLTSALAGPSLGATSACPQSPYRQRKPLVIAHASSTHFGPANTIAMMRAAVAAGADVVDADVRVTRDGALVASHDDNLATTTNESGSLRSRTLLQLRKADAAWTWPGPNGNFPLRGKGVRIPTVEEILNAFPHRQVSLEFKTTGGETALCTLLRRLGRTHDVYVSSAGDAAIDRLKPICPEVTTTVTDALVVTMRAAQENGTPWCSPAPIGQPPFRIGDRKLVTSESVRWNHDHGMAIYTWTLDNPKDLTEAFQAGVDGVYTGRADLARAIFDHPAPMRSK